MRKIENKKNGSGVTTYIYIGLWGGGVGVTRKIPDIFIIEKLSYCPFKRPTINDKPQMA